MDKSTVGGVSGAALGYFFTRKKMPVVGAALGFFLGRMLGKAMKTPEEKTAEAIDAAAAAARAGENPPGV